MNGPLSWSLGVCLGVCVDPAKSPLEINQVFLQVRGTKMANPGKSRFTVKTVHFWQTRGQIQNVHIKLQPQITVRV